MVVRERIAPERAKALVQRVVNLGWKWLVADPGDAFGDHATDHLPQPPVAVACQAEWVPPRELADTRLVLIRTAAVERRGPVRLIDHDDLGLSDEGRRQVARLSGRLDDTGEFSDAARLYSATSNRAQETAAAISPSLGGLPVQTSCGFCEPHAGQANGRTVGDWLATDGQARLDNWSPYKPKAPGGESYTVGLERAARSVTETVIENEGKTVVIITHTVPIRAAFWMFLGLPFHAGYLDLDITETGITEWLITGWLPGSGYPNARLIRFNDHQHLLGRIRTQE